MSVSLPQLAFGENMHVSYNDTHKQSYYRLRTMRNRDNEAFNKLLHSVPLMDSSNFGKNAKYCIAQTFNSLDLLL